MRDSYQGTIEFDIGEHSNSMHLRVRNMTSNAASVNFRNEDRIPRHRFDAPHSWIVTASRRRSSRKQRADRPALVRRIRDGDALAFRSSFASWRHSVVI
ncbi:hypothetical protein J5226_16950 [Lysobacter sp. K5869]|uniref:hypothetical protein n=1 Tax=Lysobacter sp. K5869 TaxID=2820808 RepID=UPI001C05F98A|nr:hypothetical protein [Lysobacter sp. K5869]QWP75306.1 hypothetical protein J5226_16950 [Lysobacter sp. K5869]